MKKITLFISALCLIGSGVFAQNTRTALPFVTSGATQAQIEQTEQQLMQAASKSPTGHIRCFTSEMEQLRRMYDPSVLTPEQFNNWINKIMKGQADNPSTQKASRNIPVVVHVIHNGDAVGSAENVSVAQINSQITALNQDFSASNSDFGNTPAVFTSVASNFDMQFCLAQIDPSGNPTTGIDRVQLGTATYSMSTAETMKPGTQWDPTKYFNIWVVNMSGGILGYAQFPNSGSANTDGVVIDYRAFGSTGSAQAPYNKGRTATHEIGHCFGLYHIWGDDGTACTGSDLVADTPNQADENYSCPNFATNTSCSNSGDMSMNYMDYTNDACMYMFTSGQKARVDAVLASAPRRASLLTSNVCSVAAINADFTANVTTINMGQTVTFTDASSSPNTLNGWTWNFDVGGLGGVSPATASTQGSHVITYNTAGTFTVSLQVTDNAAGNDLVTKTAYITVNPSGTITCDSTAADWDWTTEAFGPALWGADCNGTAPSGYIMGSNCYDDFQWSSKVSFSASGKELTDVMYLFVQSTGSGATNLRVWNADGTGQDLSGTTISTAPGTILSSTSTTSGAFSANLNQLIAVPISPAVALTGDFYIGFDHPSSPGAGDTLALGTAVGTAGNTIWVNEGGTIGWRDVEYWGSGAGGAGTPLNYKGTVVAVICDVSTGEKELLGEINEVTIFPNPSLGTINIALTSKVESTIEIYNVVGKLIYNSTLNTQLVTVDVSNQPNGVYFVNIKTGESITTKKVILSK